MHQDNFVCHCYPHIPWKVSNLWWYLICCDNQRYGILIMTSEYSKWTSCEYLCQKLNPVWKIIWSGQLCCFIRITLNWSKSIALLMTTCLQHGSMCSINYWYSLPAYTHQLNCSYLVIIQTASIALCAFSWHFEKREEGWHSNDFNLSVQVHNVWM